MSVGCRLRLKCDGTRAETRFRLSAKQTRPFKSAGASVQSTTGNRGVHISGSNAGYTMFWGSVKGTCYLLHLPVSPSLFLPCVAVRHQISTGLYHLLWESASWFWSYWGTYTDERMHMSFPQIYNLFKTRNVIHEASYILTMSLSVSNTGW
jgi:hypothetical protein